MESNASGETLIDIVESLKNYTKTHFFTEEEFFARIVYPEVDSHKLMHHRFIQKIADVEEQLRQGSLVVGNDLLDFLKDWLLNHIRVTDKQFAPLWRSWISRPDSSPCPVSFACMCSILCGVMFLVRSHASFKSGKTDNFHF